MKSPFVGEERVETYVYPNPLLPPETTDDVDLIDHEVIAEAKKPGEELPWVKFRCPKSKRDIDLIADYTQSVVMGGGTGAHFEMQIARANRSVFELLCEGWSFTEASPTAADYDRLDLWASPWITAALNDAMAHGSLAAQIASGGGPKTSDASESNGGNGSSSKPEGSRAKRPRAASRD